MKDFVSPIRVRMHYHLLKDKPSVILEIREKRYLLGAKDTYSQWRREDCKAALKAIKKIREKRKTKGPIKLKDVQFDD